MLRQESRAVLLREPSIPEVRHPRLRDVRLRRASDSFQHGMVARVAARLTAMHAEREATVAAQRSTGTALILAKHQLVETAFRATQTGWCQPATSRGG